MDTSQKRSFYNQAVYSCITYRAKRMLCGRSNVSPSYKYELECKKAAGCMPSIACQCTAPAALAIHCILRIQSIIAKYMMLEDSFQTLTVLCTLVHLLRSQPQPFPRTAAWVVGVYTPVSAPVLNTARFRPPLLHLLASQHLLLLGRGRQLRRPPAAARSRCWGLHTAVQPSPAAAPHAARAFRLQQVSRRWVRHRCTTAREFARSEPVVTL